jgi:hypothetical protein
VAQGDVPEFKPQYRKTKQNNNNKKTPQFYESIELKHVTSLNKIKICRQSFKTFENFSKPFLYLWCYQKELLKMEWQ